MPTDAETKGMEACVHSIEDATEANDPKPSAKTGLQRHESERDAANIQPSSLNVFDCAGFVVQVYARGWVRES